MTRLSRPLPRRARRAGVLGTVLLVALGPLPTGAAAAGGAARAVASTTVPASGIDAAPEPMWQTDGTVWALQTTGGRVFAGGDFTAARPPGTALDAPESVPRSRLAAFDATTGALDAAFEHRVAGRVSALAVSPDGGTLYLGGVFTAVDGQPRDRVAAIDLSTPEGTLLPFAPQLAGGFVNALAATEDALYVGGSFTTVEGAERAHLAAFDLAGAHRSSWAATVDGPVYALLVAPSRDRLVVGGAFNTANGVPLRALASFALADGTSLPMDQGLIPPCVTAGCERHSDVKALATDGERVLVGAEGTGKKWFDGTLAVDPLTGKKLWVDRCYGATQALAVLQGALYVGSHAHDCGAIGGFGQAPFQTGPASWHHLMAQSVADGRLLSWFPSTNAGPQQGTVPGELGPRALATDGTSVFAAGQFTEVDGRPQQGLARFAPGPDATVPGPVAQLSASSSVQGRVVLRWGSADDPDDGLLSYRVYRDGVLLATTAPTRAGFWRAVQHVHRDTAALAGTHEYQVEAVEPEGGVGPRSSVAVTTGSAVGGYPAAVKADRPSLWWRLNDRDANAADSSGHQAHGTYDPTVSLRRPGPWSPALAASLNDGKVTSRLAASRVPPSSSTEMWFRTTTTSGGRLAGWGSSRSGTSGKYDRVLWMNDAGQLLFGVYAGGARVVWTPRSYNDGSWHHVVATHSSKGVTLHVDGVTRTSAMTTTASAADYSGYFRLGPDALSSTWPERPTSTTFEGDLAHVALYPVVLTAAQARTHFARGE